MTKATVRESMKKIRMTTANSHHHGNVDGIIPHLPIEWGVEITTVEIIIANGVHHSEEEG